MFTYFIDFVTSKQKRLPEDEVNMSKHFNLTLYVPCIILQCVGKTRRRNTSYE